MRLRNKQWTKEFIENNNQYFLKTKNGIDFFCGARTTHLEIGCGKGKFISELSETNKNINYIAIEKEETVIGVALKTALSIRNNEISNLRFLNIHVDKLEEYFNSKTISKIYLNFSDPWPKKRHAKNRLTNLRFLKMYESILTDGGVIEIKTDNDSLYKYSLEEIAKSNFKIIYQTTDLHKDMENNKENIITEYEQKFINQNKNINKIVISK